MNWPVGYRPSLLRTLLVWLVVLVTTMFFSTACMLASVYSRRVAWRLARLWGRGWVAAAGVRLHLVGFERLDRAGRYVFVCNHQSALDIPLLYAAMPVPIAFIAKKELLVVPFMGWAAAAAGHIYIDRGNARRAHTSMIRALARLKRGGSSLIIFPEGTRSADGVVGEFKTGSFHIAIEAGVDLVPIAVRNSRQVQPKGALLVSPGGVRIDVGAPVSMQGLGKRDKAELARRVRGLVMDMMNAA
jgi:1-acyl-sn-glycerol-3-phosphate acyltransferase